MESESGKPAGPEPNAAGRIPLENPNRQQAVDETIAAGSSSFRGLVGGTGSPSPGSSFGESQAAASDSNQTLGIGQTFGRYQVRKVLGSGSMGSVFLAQDTLLDRQVALKVPKLEHAANSELSQRLYREARAAATLNHPNICPIYDVSEQGGTCFIAMGYITGQPLSIYTASKKRQPEREAAKVVRKIALALQEAHGQGILHRDLKPTNIMIDKRGEPIVMDFGVACWFEDQTQTRLTQQGALVGTPAYMSPEQIEGLTTIGPASDVYSLGVLFYQILTGRCPFEGTVLNVISQVLHQAPPDPTKSRPELSPELVAICHRAMQKNPADRYASMHDFAKALTTFLNGPRGDKLQNEEIAIETIEMPRPKAARPASPAQPAPRARSAPAPVLPPLPRRGGRKQTAKKTQPNWLPAAIAGGAVTALLIVGGVLGAMLVRGRETSDSVARNQSPEPAEATPAATKPEQPVTERPKLSTRQPAIAASGSSAASGAKTSPAANGPVLNSPIPNAVATSTNSPAATRSTSPTAPASPLGSTAPANATASSSGSRPIIPGPAAPSNGVSKPASAPASSVARDDPSDAARPGPRPGVSANDEDGPPPQNSSRRRKGQQPPGDGPPERRPGGVMFDGGPAKGMSIEDYFPKVDTNHDGRLDSTELPLHIIRRADTDKDGELTMHELQQAYKRKGRKLFSPPTAAEMRRLPRGGPPPPRNGSAPEPGGPNGPGSF
jgi:serine/threonine protein kinase